MARIAGEYVEIRRKMMKKIYEEHGNTISSETLKTELRERWADFKTKNDIKLKNDGKLKDMFKETPDLPESDSVFRKDCAVAGIRLSDAVRDTWKSRYQPETALGKYIHKSLMEIYVEYRDICCLLYQKVTITRGGSGEEELEETDATGKQIHYEKYKNRFKSILVQRSKSQKNKETTKNYDFVHFRIILNREGSEQSIASLFSACAEVLYVAEYRKCVEVVCKLEQTESVAERIFYMVEPYD